MKFNENRLLKFQKHLLMRRNGKWKRNEPKKERGKKERNDV